MATLMDIEGVDLAKYARGALTTGEVPLSFEHARIDAEATRLPFVLVAVDGDRVVSDLDLMLSFRVRVDDVLHLWSQDDRNALEASVVIDAVQDRLTLTLRFEPVHKLAITAARVARFLQAAIEAGTLAVRLPDGRVSPDRIPVPEQLRVDHGVVNLLELMADVSRLARVELHVPEEVTDDALDDLLVARSVLRGQEVRGTWDVGELTMHPGGGLDALRQAFAEKTRHEFLMVSDVALEIFGTRIELGEVQQQFSDAVVDSVAEESGVAKVRIRAHAGRGHSVLRPIARQVGPLDPDVVVPRDVFEQMLSDEGDDERRLRELL